MDCQLAQIQREREVENEWENMRNVIRLVGMFWLIENALQVGTVGDPEGKQRLHCGRQSVINVRLSCKFKFVQAKSKKAAQEISKEEAGEGQGRSS